MGQWSLLVESFNLILCLVPICAWCILHGNTNIWAANVRYYDYNIIKWHTKNISLTSSTRLCKGVLASSTHRWSWFWVTFRTNCGTVLAKISLFSLLVLSAAAAVSDNVKAEAMTNLKKLVRNRRNVPVVAVPQFKRMPDFWGWYKYFMDTHNQEGVSGACFKSFIHFYPSHNYEAPRFFLKTIHQIALYCCIKMPFPHWLH